MSLPVSPKPNPQEPMVVRPHHIERIARAIMMKEKTGSPKPADIEDFETLQWVLDENPNADIIFVDDTSEPNCQFCIYCVHGGIPGCRDDYATEEEPRGELHVSKFDREVAEAQGWEFGKAYKLADIVQLFTQQAALRTMFYMCELGEEQYKQWRADAKLIKETRSG
ncbi:hypothetical protein ACFL3T_00120 [Patescibacteria group bacterium]